MQVLLALIFSSCLDATWALTMHAPNYVRSPAASLVEQRLAILTKASNAELFIEHKTCTNLDNIQMDAGSLPPVSPGLELYHVAVGRGTQNYTCPTTDPNAPPQSLGALATLYNVTCLLDQSLTGLYSNFVNTILTTPLPNPVTCPQLDALSGHHYFTNGNITATFNLNAPLAKYGITFATKAAAIPAPTTAKTGLDGSKAVPWLKLQSIGSNPKPDVPDVTISAADAKADVQEIYRINTAGGAAPATCVDHVGQTFQQDYVAEYWFWHKPS